MRANPNISQIFMKYFSNISLPNSYGRRLKAIQGLAGQWGPILTWHPSASPPACAVRNEYYLKFEKCEKENIFAFWLTQFKFHDLLRVKKFYSCWSPFFVNSISWGFCNSQHGIHSVVQIFPFHLKIASNYILLRLGCNIEEVQCYVTSWCTPPLTFAILENNCTHKLDQLQLLQNTNNKYTGVSWHYKFCQKYVPRENSCK